MPLAGRKYSLECSAHAAVYAKDLGERSHVDANYSKWSNRKRGGQPVTLFCSTASLGFVKSCLLPVIKQLLRLFRPCSTFVYVCVCVFTFILLFLILCVFYVCSCVDLCV